MEDEFEDIRLDFKSSEILQVEEYRELLQSTADICDIECLGAPFLPKCKRGSCPCDILRKANKRMEEQSAGEVKDYRVQQNVSCQDSAELKKKNASLHLDEFLLELLNTGRHGAYIHWTVKERKEFKITRPQRIAALWGDRKCRKMMTDEKLLRAIRVFQEKFRTAHVYLPVTF